MELSQRRQNITSELANGEDDVLSTNLRASIGLNITREVRKTELGSYSVFKNRTVQKFDTRPDGMPIETAACVYSLQYSTAIRHSHNK